MHQTTESFPIDERPSVAPATGIAVALALCLPFWVAVLHVRHLVGL